jgi:hypothetical protein
LLVTPAGNAIDFGITTPNVLTLVAPVLTNGATATTQPASDTTSAKVATQASVAALMAAGTLPISGTTIAASTGVATGGASVPSLPSGAAGCDWYYGGADYTAVCAPTTLSQNLALLWPNANPAGSVLQFPAPTGGVSQGVWVTIPSVGTWGALNYPTWTSGTPFVKMTAAGTFALDTNTYLTAVPAQYTISPCSAQLSNGGSAITAGTYSIVFNGSCLNTYGVTYTIAHASVYSDNSSGASTCTVTRSDSQTVLTAFTAANSAWLNNADANLSGTNNTVASGLWLNFTIGADGTSKIIKCVLTTTR